MTAVFESDADAAALASKVLDEEARRHAERDGRDGVTIDVRLVAGVGGDAMPLRAVLGAGGIGTIGVLAGLVLMDAVFSSAFFVLGPDIQRSLHLSDVVLGVVGALGGLMVFVAAVPLGYLGDRSRRTIIVAVSSLCFAAFVALTGVVTAAWQLVVTMGASGAAKANEQPVHSALLADAYPIEGRNRVFGLHRAAQPLGFVLGPVVAGVIASAAGHEGWRWTFALLAIPAAVLALAASTLKEPRRGSHEMRAILGEELSAEEGELPTPVGAAFARLKKVKTYYFLLCSLGALGLAFVAAPIYTNLILQHHFHLGSYGRGVVGTIAASGGLLGVVVSGTAGDRIFRRSPEQAILVTGGLVAASGVFLGGGVYMPNLSLYTAMYWLGNACVFAAFVPISATVAAVTPYRLRSMGFALVGVYLSLIGGLGGVLLVGALAEGLGERAALAIVTPPAALVGGALLAYGASFVRSDIAAAGSELIEEREERARVAAGGLQPILQVRNLDFSYGAVQVLFGVNVDVHRGEVLALLGTNGAGKSTLLRAISGLDPADRGVIRLEGRTITFADPLTRVRLGIVQVMGGKAIFPTLTVHENLRAGAFVLRGDARTVDSRIGRAMELFPLLAERADQPAGTLSGGEQQMLALASALLLEPKVLLIDELSLGLAPIVVQQLLATIEGLKAQGLTMVIVEQSVNVALAVADRAVFMEKGQVRFEGPAADLVDRTDLVRAVFLGQDGG